MAAARGVHLRAWMLVNDEAAPRSPCVRTTPRRLCRASWASITMWALAASAGAGCGRSEPGARAIVSNEIDGTVAVIDLRSNEKIATIPVGKRPRGMRASRDGTQLYVALSGSPRATPGVDESTLPPPDRHADGIGVVDLRALTLVRTIPSGQDPNAFDLVGDDVLVVSNQETAEASIVDIPGRRVRARIRVGGEPEGVTTAPDGTVWVTSESEHEVSVIDPVRDAVIATVPTGLRPRALAFTPDGALALVTGEMDSTVTLIDARTRRWLSRIEVPPAGSSPVGPRPMGIALSRDGRHAYVATGRGGSLAVLDVHARKVVRVISDVGARPWGVAVAPDGRVLTANGASNDVAIIDPASGEVSHRIATGASPWGVVVVP